MESSAAEEVSGQTAVWSAATPKLVAGVVGAAEERRAEELVEALVVFPASRQAAARGTHRVPARRKRLSRARQGRSN